MNEVTLILHFIGLGLLITTSVGGFLLNRQYRKAQDLRTKAVILQSARPFGLLSPVAMLLMLITGIGNMHALGLGIFTIGWLSAKLAIFTVAVIAGIFLGIIARKRGRIVQAMSAGETDPGAEGRLSLYDTVIMAGYIIMPLLLVVILWLSVFGRHGALPDLP